MDIDLNIYIYISHRVPALRYLNSVAWPRPSFKFFRLLQPSSTHQTLGIYPQVLKIFGYWKSTLTRRGVVHVIILTRGPHMAPPRGPNWGIAGIVEKISVGIVGYLLELLCRSSFSPTTMRECGRSVHFGALGCCSKKRIVLRGPGIPQRKLLRPDATSLL